MINPCFLLADRPISFDEFFDDVLTTQQVANNAAGESFLLFDDDSYRFTVLLFALIRANKQVLLPPNNQPGTLVALAQYCDGSAGEITLANKPHVAAQQTKHDHKNGGEQNSISGTEQLLARVAELFIQFDGLITFFTSGSTGKPKVITKHCWQLTKELEILAKTFTAQLDSGQWWVSTVSHQHIYGLLFKVLLPLKLAKTIVNQTFEYPENIVRDLAEQVFHQHASDSRGVVLVTSPAHITRLVIDNVLEDKKHYFSAAFSSGGLLPYASSCQFYQQMAFAPIEVYGSTETGGIAWRAGQSTAEQPWQVFDNITCQSDEQSQCLVISSPYLTEQPYTTDDCVDMIDHQHFILKGRADRTVKIEEKRVNLTHVEQTLIAHPWVVDARVMVKSRNTGLTERNILAAAIVLTLEGQQQLNQQGKKQLNEMLNKHLLSDFERIALPKKWRYLVEFPYNSQGKLILATLENLFD